MGTVTQDTAIPVAARRAPRISRTTRFWRRLALVAGVVVVIAAAAALVIGLTGRSSSDAVAIPVPGAPTGIAATGDLVWVAAAGSHAIWAIDAASGRQAGRGIRTGGAPSRLAVGSGGLWIADTARGSVIPVDTGSQRVFGDVEVGADVTDVELAAGAVWVASSAEGMVRVIEPAGRPVRRLSVGGDPVDLAADGRWVVVTGGGGTLTRIDAGTRRVVGEPVDVGGLPVAVAVSGDTAWVADSSRGTVGPVDLATGRPRGAIEVGSKPVAVAADGDDVWVLTRGDRTLVRVDGRKGEVVSRRELEVDPTALALDDHYVWVASAEGREVLRIER